MKPSKLHILVLGKNGQLGKSLYQLIQNSDDYTYTFLDSSEVDLTNSGSILGLSNKKFDVLVNAAAYTAVDKAEAEKDICFRINADAVEELAEICHQKGAILIHYSSDYVYHNTLRRPLKETDPTTPKNTYAASKLLGEVKIRNTTPNHIIIRTSWLFSEHGHNFVKTMLRLASGPAALRVVNDQVGSPTYASDLAQVTLLFLDKIRKHPDSTEVLGTFNFSNSGVTTWYGFAVEVFNQAHLQIAVTPIDTLDFPTAAERPPYSVLDCSKLSTTLGFHIPSWQNGLIRCIQKLQ